MRTDPVPTGPVETEPAGFVPAEQQRERLLSELAAAGVELGAYDERIVEWLTVSPGYEWSTVATVASWVKRAGDPLAADATEYRVHLPENGGTTLLVRRQSWTHGAGWAVSTYGPGGGLAWTAEGWQDGVSALSLNRLFCWPDPHSAIEQARQALAPVPAQAPAEKPQEQHGTDFFAPGHSYHDQDGYTAPEQSQRFDCRHVTVTPNGDRIAFGFVRIGYGDWTPTGFGTADWDRYPWQASKAESH